MLLWICMIVYNFALLLLPLFCTTTQTANKGSHSARHHDGHPPFAIRHQGKEKNQCRNRRHATRSCSIHRHSIWCKEKTRKHRNPAASPEALSGEHCILLFVRRLGRGNLIDKQPHTTLRNDVRDAVPDLDTYHRM